MRLSSSTHANGAIKEIADRGLQLNLVSNNHWQWKDAAQTKLIMKARGLRWGSGGGSGHCVKPRRQKSLIHAPREHAPTSRFYFLYTTRTRVHNDPSMNLCKSRWKICRETAVCWSSRPSLSAHFQANCKWVPTSGLQYAATAQCVNKRRTTRADSHRAAPHANAASTRGPGTW